MSAASPSNTLPQTAQEWTVSLLGGLDVSALIVLSIGVVAGAWWTWRSLDGAMSLRLRAGIAVLRISALLVVFFMLVQPTLRLRTSTFSPARVAMLIDASGSMRRGTDGSRLENAIAKADLVGRQLSRRGSTLEWYCFTDEVRAVTGAAEAAQCEFEGRGTDLSKSIGGTVAVDDRSTPLSAMVLFSDGADTSNAQEDASSGPAAWASIAGVPINTIAFTGASARRDIAIAKVRADRFAFTRTPTSIEVSLAAVGADGENVEVLLLRDGAVLRRGECEIVDQSGRVSFVFSPVTLGEHVLEVALSPSHQDDIPENDRAFLSLSVIRDKYRVLHLAGRPSWDLRFLRSALKAWPKMDLVSFYVLRTEFQSEARDSGGMALIPFPTDELFDNHLSEFDVVFIQDLELATVGIDQYLPRISEFVRQGGGLVYIAGLGGLPPSIAAQEDLQGILPFRPLPPGVSTSLFEPGIFRAQVLPDGEKHPLLALSEDPRESRLLWQALPSLEGYARVARLSPSALALVGHPTATFEDGSSPVIAVQEAGAGRSLGIASPSLWRWGFTGPMTGGPRDIYSAFWHRAISWLTRDPSLDRLRLSVQPTPARIGGSLMVEVEVLDEAYQPESTAPVEISLSWTNPDKSLASHEVKQSTDAQGKYRLEWRPHSPGPHLLVVRSSTQRLESQLRFLVLPSSDEVRHLEPRRDLLEALARESGGSFQENTAIVEKLRGLDDTRSQLISTRDISLWSHPLTLLVLLALLGAEWLLRRRGGLM
jgi:hypothetical protein